MLYLNNGYSRYGLTIYKNLPPTVGFEYIFYYRGKLGVVLTWAKIVKSELILLLLNYKYLSFTLACIFSIYSTLKNSALKNVFGNLPPLYFISHRSK